MTPPWFLSVVDCYHVREQQMMSLLALHTLSAVACLIIELFPSSAMLALEATQNLPMHCNNLQPYNS
jgi:hypothetical protein